MRSSLVAPLAKRHHLFHWRHGRRWEIAGPEGASIVSHAVQIDLSPNTVATRPELRRPEIGLAQIGPIEQRAAQFGVRQDSARQVGAAQQRLAQRRPAEISASQLGPEKGGWRRRFAHIRLRQIRAVERRAA